MPTHKIETTLQSIQPAPVEPLESPRKIYRYRRSPPPNKSENEDLKVLAVTQQIWETTELYRKIQKGENTLEQMHNLNDRLVKMNLPITPTICINIQPAKRL